MVLDFSVNYWAVLAAAVLNMAVGMFWYSKLVFGKTWMKLIGVTEKQMEKKSKEEGMGSKMFWASLSSLVTAFVLVNLTGWTGSTTFLSGMLVGGVAWLGFVTTTQLSGVLWKGESVALYVLNIAQYLVALMLMGGLVSVWV
jgi:hypothetical protein